ncbi:site-specific integrase [Brevibacillus parabrevis]|uniref:site-specific integrase n=1 Tax=Brevibacillus parabrevis TaxID=54914 RepID=UPI001F60CDF4|nr:site-specific integrase [Brevibacillus parabrevis]MDR4998974.1 site-specific integrase [Brevibacillus parabrevis]
MAGSTIKKDGKTWYFVLTYGKKADGKQKQYKRRGFKTKQEAQKAYNELIHSLENGTYIEPSKMLYKDYMLDHWLKDKQTRVKKQTLRTYRWLVEMHILNDLGNIELTKLSPMIIQGLYNRLTEEKILSDENIQKVHTIINDSLRKAERWDLIPKNPAARVDRPKAVKKEITVWTVEEVKRFLKHADGYSRYSIAFLLALSTGARQGEVLGLRFKDVDFDNGCIRITQTLSNDGKEILPYTKTKSGARTIDLPEETIIHLRKHKELITKEKQAVGANAYCDLDLVVCTEIGTPTNKSNLRRIFNSIIKKANVPKIRFHDLRHTHATLLLLQGVNPKIVSERLGHADVRLTLDTYSHLLPSMQKETARNFGKMIFGDDTNDKMIIEIDL